MNITAPPPTITTTTANATSSTICNDTENVNISQNDYKKLIQANNFEVAFSKNSKIKKIIFTLVLISFVFTLPQLFSYNLNETKLNMNKIFIIKSTNNNKFNMNNRRLSDISTQSIASFTLIKRTSNNTSNLLSPIKNYKISSIKYEFCSLLNNKLNENEFQNEYNRQQSPSNEQIDDKPKVTISNETKTKPIIANLTITCLHENDILAASLLYNTLYFWLLQTISLFIPFIILFIYLTIFIYILRNRDEYFKNYYYFLNKENSLEKIVTVKTLMSDYKIPKYDCELLDKKHNMLINERINQAKIYIFNIIGIYLLVMPYIFFRFILALYVKEKFKISLDFYILYKFIYLLVHVYLIFKFFLLLMLSYKFRICILNVFSCQFIIDLFSKQANASRKYKKFCSCLFSKNKFEGKNYDNMKHAIKFDASKHKYSSPANYDQQQQFGEIDVVSQTERRKSLTINLQNKIND